MSSRKMYPAFIFEQTAFVKVTTEMLSEKHQHITAGKKLHGIGNPVVNLINFVYSFNI